MNVKYYFVLILSVFAASCTNTKIIDDWVHEDHNKPYSHPMIIGISDSQQTRQIYEKYFVSELEKVNIAATPSYKLINSKQKLNREIVIKAVEDTDIEIDSVLVTYLVSSETEVKHHVSPLNRNYSGDIDNSKMSATLIATRGRTSNTEIITLKNDLYDVKTRTLVWTAQTRTVAPESIDEVVTNVVELLINEMLAENVIK